MENIVYCSLPSLYTSLPYAADFWVLLWVFDMCHLSEFPIARCRVCGLLSHDSCLQRQSGSDRSVLHLITSHYRLQSPEQAGQSHEKSREIIFRSLLIALIVI